ncbi:MAG: Lrp/AsnC family transcriptional regulator [Nanoarchaeota archaeon]
MEIDQKDKSVLEALKQNARLTTKEIAKKVRLPITTVHNRIKKLEKLGVIKNYTLNLNYHKLGKPILAYILISVNYTMPNGNKINQENIAMQISKLEGVEETSIVTGVTDIFAKVRVASIEELNDLLIKRLRNIDGVDKTQTFMALNTFARQI